MKQFIYKYKNVTLTIILDNISKDNLYFDDNKNPNIVILDECFLKHQCELIRCSPYYGKRKNHKETLSFYALTKKEHNMFVDQSNKHIDYLFSVLCKTDTTNNGKNQLITMLENKGFEY